MIFVTGDTHGPEKLGFLSVDGYMPRLNRPASDRVCLGYEEDTRLTSFLEKVKQKTNFKHWFFGHLCMIIERFREERIICCMSRLFGFNNRDDILKKVIFVNGDRDHDFKKEKV